MTEKQTRENLIGKGQPGPGRPKGKPNKTTTALKEAILKAAEETGLDGNGAEGTVGYLKMLAMKEPTSFAGLLGKVLPLTIGGDPENPLHMVNHDADEFTGRVLRLAASRAGAEGTRQTKH